MVARVLALIEDKLHAQTIGSCLRDAGHAAILVENFSQAKFALLEARCDLILSDVHLQNGGNVFEFIKWVKQKPLLKPIPFVLLSVEPTETAKYLSDGVRVAARFFGASKYILLPQLDPHCLMAELAEFFPESESIPVEPQ